MKGLIKMALVFCLFCAGTVNAAPNNSQKDIELFSDLLYGRCSVGNCDGRLDPNDPKDAGAMITNAAYIIYNADSDKLMKYNAPLKNMGIENAVLIPQKWLEDAVCKYYGHSIGKYPELQKALEEQAKNGFYTLGVSDAGEPVYEIEKLELLKNGVMRASGTSVFDEDQPFRAYFGKSNCGGKPHWVLLRVVDLKPNEESEDYSVTME